MSRGACRGEEGSHLQRDASAACLSQSGRAKLVDSAQLRPKLKPKPAGKINSHREADLRAIASRLGIERARSLVKRAREGDDELALLLHERADWNLVEGEQLGRDEVAPEGVSSGPGMLEACGGVAPRLSVQVGEQPGGG